MSPGVTPAFYRQNGSSGVVGLVGQQCSCPRPAPKGERRPANLEDVFLKLTGRDLKE